MSFLCCSQHKKDNAINYKIKKMNDILNGFSTPDKQTFESRIKEVFGVDINVYRETQQVFSGTIPKALSKDTKVLIPRYGFISEAESQPMVHLDKFYISWNDPEEDNNSLLFLNKYIFYNDDLAFNYLKMRKSGYLYYLVIDFGYTKDPKIVDFILDEIGTNFDDDEANEFASRVFIGSEGVLGKRQIRKDLLRQYYEKYPESEYMYFNLADKILENSEVGKIKYDGDKYENAAFLIELQLEYANKQLGTSLYGGVDYILKKYPDFLAHLKKNNAYHYKLLSNYKLYNEQEEEIIEYAIIHDPDGFTNLRKDKTTTSEVLQRIKLGEQVEVLDNSGNWYLVKTKEGKKGYVHKSRIKTE